MKTLKYSFVILISIMFIFLAGCNGNNSPTSPFNASKSSKLIMKVNSFHKSTASVNNVKVKNSSNSTYLQFPVLTGKLNVKSALINITNLNIQENSGFDGEYTGNNNDGKQDNSGGPETENPDVTAPGPYSIDISSGTANLGNFSVYPGTFKKVNFQLTKSSANPYAGKSMIMKGEYLPNSGSPIPFTIKSALSTNLQLPIANGGITVKSNSSVTIAIVIDLPGLFKNIDFSKAVVSNGSIFIDNQNNYVFLKTLENNLKKYVDAENEIGPHT